MEQRVENELFLVRETSSGAILNNDKSSYDAILANKARRKTTEETLRGEIAELRALVMALTKG